MKYTCTLSTLFFAEEKSWMKLPVVGFRKSDLSASEVARNAPEAIAPFSQFLFSNGYIPNQRLRRLLSTTWRDRNQEDLQLQTFHKFCGNLRERHDGTPKFFISDKATEDLIVLPYFLKVCRELIYALKQLAPNLSLLFQHELVNMTDYFAASCKPEPVFTILKNGGSHDILVGSEVKGLEKSTYRCFSQVFMVCANAAISLRLRGVDVKNCVIPGICYAGDGFRFVAVYLVEPTWPVMVVLSDALDVRGESVITIADWLFRIVDFANDTALFLQ